MLYFAYGSNLSVKRMQARVPSAQKLTVAKLFKHSLLFHKIGRDNSAKCDAYETGNKEHYVLGVVYDISSDEKKYLDAAEGLGKGYEIKEVKIHTPLQELLMVYTYYATRIDAHLTPFDWYKIHVLQGMYEHDFPKEYILSVKKVTASEDKNLKRRSCELSIYKKTLQ